MTTTTIRFYEPAANPALTTLRDSVIKALENCARYEQAQQPDAVKAAALREHLLQALDRVEQLVPSVVASDDDWAQTQEQLLASAKGWLADLRAHQAAWPAGPERPAGLYWLPTEPMGRQG